VGSRSAILVAVLLLASTAVAGCDEGMSDGPIKDICGTNIGRATASVGSGPWYIDASRKSPSAPILVAADSSPMNVRVSPDCSTGAKVSVSGAAVINVMQEIQANDGADEVLLITPVAIGRSTVTIKREASKPITVKFIVQPSQSA